jgi:hypothetical protein
VDPQLLILCALTFVIHLIGTLAYAVRIAGVRTRRIAVCFALFNILVLVSRTSNSFQGPFLAKRIEENIAHGVSQSLLSDFRCLLLSATLATLVGAFLIPTFQRLFSLAVRHFQVHRSLPRLLMHGFFKGGLGYVREAVRLPSSQNMTPLKAGRAISPWVVVSNVLAVALWTIGVFAALYAGVLNPELRVTASTLSSVVNGVATILMFAFIDPHLSVMTDDVIEGQTSESKFRRAIVWLVGSRLAGTLLGQVLLVPCAVAIAAIAAAM